MYKLWKLFYSLNLFLMTVLQVKIQPVAKYDWEHKYYYGNLIAVSNSYLAYAIRGRFAHFITVCPCLCAWLI